MFLPTRHPARGRHRRLSIVLLVVAWLLVPSSQAAEPLGMLLTWQDDPTTTMTIEWHTGPEVDARTNAQAIEYRPRDAACAEWRRAPARSRPFPFSERRIHRVSLRDLQPDTAYSFRVDGGREWWFRTMPATASRPIRFVNGGDSSVGEAFRATNRSAMRHDPDFVLMGGDIAYANGDPQLIGRWYEWFDGIMRDFVTESGRVVPMVVAIGNHEVFEARRRTPEELALAEQRWGIRPGDVPFYYELFALPERRGYYALDFGDYLSLIVLDTDHSTSVVGAQTQWLALMLEQRSGVPHLFPVYHVPAYPSVRRFEGATSAVVREHWVPLFERHGIRVAFEHHDHVYKRSHPLRGGVIAEDGIVYLGDGAWGVGTRAIGRDQGLPAGAMAWYLQQARSANHYIVVTLDGANSHFLAVDNVGEVIDEYLSTARYRP